jgi:hypothetical protein
MDGGGVHRWTLTVVTRPKMLQHTFVSRLAAAGFQELSPALLLALRAWAMRLRASTGLTQPAVIRNRGRCVKRGSVTCVLNRSRRSPSDMTTFEQVPFVHKLAGGSFSRTTLHAQRLTIDRDLAVLSHHTATLDSLPTGARPCVSGASRAPVDKAFAAPINTREDARSHARWASVKC